MPVAEPIRHAEALIQQALTLKRSDETRTVQQDTQPVKSVKTELKQALLSGISFAVPLIVAGGTVLAVAVLLSQIFGYKICLMKKTPGCGCTASWAAGCSGF